VGNKSAVTRLGFGVLLKFFQLEARFPRHGGKVPKAAVRYVAGQVKVDYGLYKQYAWSDSTIKYRQAQIYRVGRRSDLPERRTRRNSKSARRAGQPDVVQVRAVQGLDRRGLLRGPHQVSDRIGWICITPIA
jgi:hypothetical protein